LRATLRPPPLIKPDERVYRIRLSENTPAPRCRGDSPPSLCAIGFVAALGLSFRSYPLSGPSIRPLLFGCQCSSTAPSLQRRYRLHSYHGPLRLLRRHTLASRLGGLCARLGFAALHRRPQPLTSLPALALRARRPRRDDGRSSGYFDCVGVVAPRRSDCAPGCLRRCTSGSTSRLCL
jgi:hypothetical protein